MTQPPKNLPVSRNPSLLEVRRLLEKQSHLRGAASADDLFVWSPNVGDHAMVIEQLGLPSQDVLPLRIFEQYIEPNFHMSLSKWDSASEYEVASFLEGHPSVKYLLSFFEIL